MTNAHGPWYLTPGVMLVMLIPNPTIVPIARLAAQVGDFTEAFGRRAKLASSSATRMGYWVRSETGLKR